MVTFAPGISAPVGSAMWPRRVAVEAGAVGAGACAAEVWALPLAQQRSRAPVKS